MLPFDNDDGVHVVRHHNVRIHLNVVMVSGQRLQLRFGDKANARELNLAIHNLAENAGMTLRAQGHEVPAARAVVLASEPS